MEEWIYNHPIKFAIIAILSFLLPILILVYAGGRYSCNKKSEIMGIESNFGIFTGCMVKIDGRWQPFNDYNTINIK